MRYLTTFLIVLSMVLPAMSVEQFRYRGAAKDGGTLEYLFETDEENLLQTVGKKKVTEIAADFMTVFYHIQIGALETQELRTAAGPILAGLLFGHGQGASATNVLRRSDAGWEGC